MDRFKSQNIFSLLQVEHRQLQQLFLVAAKVDSSNTYNGCNLIYELLSLHTRDEDRIFYSATQECETTKNILKTQQTRERNENSIRVAY